MNVGNGFPPGRACRLHHGRDQAGKKGPVRLEETPVGDPQAMPHDRTGDEPGYAEIRDHFRNSAERVRGPDGLPVPGLRDPP